MIWREHTKLCLHLLRGLDAMLKVKVQTLEPGSWLMRRDQLAASRHTLPQSSGRGSAQRAVRSAQTDERRAWSVCHSLYTEASVAAVIVVGFTHQNWRSKLRKREKAVFLTIIHLDHCIYSLINLTHLMHYIYFISMSAFSGMPVHWSSPFAAGK